MPRYRTIADLWMLERAEKLTPAEAQLVDACVAGKNCWLGDGNLPPEPAEGHPPDPARTIRADVLRCLILGGEGGTKTDERGVQLYGAHVTGRLDLDFATTRGGTLLARCRFDEKISALQSRFEALNLTGSALPGLFAQGATVAGNVLLRTLTASGTLDLAGAEIGGQIDCTGSNFTAEGDALNAQGAKVAGSVFLRTLTASGTLALNSAEIGGQLSCIGSSFTAEGDALNAQDAKVAGNVFLSNLTASGTLDLAGAEIRGQIGCEGSRFTAEGVALNVQQLRAAEFYWRGVKQVAGIVRLDSAQVGTLVDDLESWPPADQLILGGFTYDRLSGHPTPTDAPTRLAWLARGDTWNGTFTPQPYTQLAKVLREMGHEADARVILRERERRMAKEQLRSDRQTLYDLRHSYAMPSDRPSILPHQFALQRRRLWSAFLGGVIGYGYAPFRSVELLLVMIGVTWALAFGTWEYGDFVPASPAAALSQDWRKLADDPAIANPAPRWTAAGQPGASYEHFSAPAYAASLVVPVLSFGQLAPWQPAEDRGWLGTAFWWLRWPIEAMGWLVSALGVAAVGGLIRHE